jgi:hypothetical protein
MPNSSRFAARGNVTFGGMGGKSGKKRQESGNGWHGGRQKRQGFVWDATTSRARRERLPSSVDGHGWRGMRLFKALTARGGGV